METHDGSVDELRKRVMLETMQTVAGRLTNLLPVPTIAQVCEMTLQEVLAVTSQKLANESGDCETKNSHRALLLDKSVNRITIPMAVTTQRTLERHKQALENLKKYLSVTWR